MANNSQIISLAREILASAENVEAYCQENNVARPSFDADGPSSFQIPRSHPEAAQAHAMLLMNTLKLHHLASGPTALLMSSSLDDTISLHAVHRFGIARAVPIGADISFEDLSAVCGLNLIDLIRIVRHAMTRHTFRESRPGFVAHTAASKVLAENQLIRDFVGIQCDEKFKAAAFNADALSKWNGARDPAQTGFGLGHGTKKGLYDELRDHPSRARRFANAMSQYASRIPLDPLFNGFDWKGLGEATVVDVGGGHGAVSIGLAQKFRGLHFIVQDLPDVVNPRPHVSRDVSDRIDFMVHDFLLEQPVKGAAVYFSRAVYHNWPDTQCIQALRHQASAMGEASLLIINEPLLHEPGTATADQDRKERDMDMSMMAYFGSRERDENDWRMLLREADSRLELRSVTLPEAGANHILVISIKPDE